jgi:formylglycine-generating enzyme required for sulfatase activity
VPFGNFGRGGSLEAGGTLAGVSSFYLDKYEVTVERFGEFIDNYDAWRAAGHPQEGAAAYPPIPGSGWHTRWNNALPESSAAFGARVSDCFSLPFFSTFLHSSENPTASNANLPMNCLSWFEAFAFCAWDGGRLPTELEWEFAAAGGEQNRVYPWGSSPDPTPDLAEYSCGLNAPPDTGGEVLALGDGGADASVAVATCELPDLLPVGSKPLGAGRFGHLDLAGSLAEWVLDGGARYPDGCFNCAEIATESHRMFRGGSWFASYPSQLQVTDRAGTDPAGRLQFLGVRCASTNYR